MRDDCFGNEQQVHLTLLGKSMFILNPLLIALAKKCSLAPLGELVLNLAPVNGGIKGDEDWELWNPLYQSLVQEYISKQVDQKAKAIRQLKG